MMRAVYFYDALTRQFTKVDLIGEEEKVPDNATLIQPINEDGTGMYDPRWDGEKWISKTYEEWESEQPVEPEPEEPVKEPTTEQLMINQLGIRVAKLEEQNKEGA